MACSLSACGSNNTNGNAKDSGIKEVPLDKEVVLVDNENITITATAKYEVPCTNFTDHEVGYRVFIENHSDYYASVSYERLSVGGFMVDERFGYIDVVAPEKKAYSSLAIYVGEDVTNNTVETIDDLFDTEGIIRVSINTDGSNHYTVTDWGCEFHID